MSQLTNDSFVEFVGFRPLAFRRGPCYHFVYSMNYYRWEPPPETREGTAMEERTELREELLRDAWGYASPGDTRTVDVHVQRLRKKLGFACIETVYRLGYKLRAQEVY